MYNTRDHTIDILFARWLQDQLFDIGPVPAEFRAALESFINCLDEIQAPVFTGEEPYVYLNLRIVK